MLALFEFDYQLFVEVVSNESVVGQDILVNPEGVQTRGMRIMYTLTPTTKNRFIASKDTQQLIPREWMSGSYLLAESSLESYLQSYMNASLPYNIPRVWYHFIMNGIGVQPTMY